MNIKNKQQGMTLIGMLLTMAIVILVGITVMRVVPVYLQHYSVISSVNALTKIPASELSGEPAVTANALKSKLMNQLYVNSIDLPQEQIQVIPNEEGNYQVLIKYQVIKPLFGNVSLLFDFNESKEVVIHAE